MNRPTRREFVKQAATGAAALGAICTLAPPQPVSAATRKKTKVRIGTRINRAWLGSENDDDLRFLKQIGVNYVDITMDLVDGYRETGTVTKATLKKFLDRLDAVGLKIERANTSGSYYRNAHINKPGSQPEIDNLKQIGELLAEAEIPVFGIQACQAATHVENSRGGWQRSVERGGYFGYGFDQKKSVTNFPKPKYRVTAEQLWDGILNIYRQVIPIVDGSKTRVAMHGNDPPLYDYLGNPQILCRFADFDRLFSEVPSANNGITFCVGTRYESGENIYEGIRHFGRQGKLFHVHFRNVQGTLPKDQGYKEVFLDDGDMNMAEVLRTLDEVGYDGVIDYDHPMGITGDQPIPKQYIAFAVGYQRGLLHSLTE